MGWWNKNGSTPFQSILSFSLLKPWTCILYSLPPVKYDDFCDSAQHYSHLLRTEHACDMVIALTHMRVPNDQRLARECTNHIDLVLGGHDHFAYYDDGVDLVIDHAVYVPAEIRTRDIQASGPKLRLIKSGTDFRELTKVTLTLDWNLENKCTVTHVKGTFQG